VLKTRLDCVNITNFSLPFVSEENDDISDDSKNKVLNAAEKRKVILEHIK